MNLYLINAATDAKRQVYLHMTEAQDLEFAKQIKKIRLKKADFKFHGRSPAKPGDDIPAECF